MTRPAMYSYKPWAFVCPASRGIGHAVARHLLRTTRVPVVATARTDLDGTRHRLLDGLPAVESSRLHVLHVDVADESTVAAAVAQCRTLFPPPAAASSGEHAHAHAHACHLAFLCPGILIPERKPADIRPDAFLDTIAVNTLGPLLLLKHLIPLLPTSSSTGKGTRTPAPPNNEEEGVHAPGLPATAMAAVLSARVGSVSDNTNLGGWWSYRISKAGVNQLVRTYDNYLRRVAGERACVLGLHPGTVRTGLSEPFWAGVPAGKLFEVGWVAERLLGVLGEVGVKGRGRCWDWKGEEVLP